MSLKYVRALYQGEDIVFSFPKLINHNDFTQSMKLSGDDIISAGFIRMNKNKHGSQILTCFGKSVSLRKASLPEDSDLATRQHYSEMGLDDLEHYKQD